MSGLKGLTREATRGALVGSIAKWQRLVDDSEAYDNGASDCPLCQLFMHSDDPKFNCYGCPVFEKTERAHCKGTPYQDFQQADRVFQVEHYSDSQSAQVELARDVRTEAAIVELEFLKRLLKEFDARG